MKVEVTLESETPAQICERFAVFVGHWVGEYCHWKRRGQTLVHVRNLGVAAMRFAEKIDEIMDTDETNRQATSYATNWSEIHGFFRKR